MRAIRFIAVLIIAVLVGYYIGITKVNFAWENYHPQISVASKEPPSGVSNLDMSEFWTVFEKVQAGYYDKKAIDPQKMLNGAISGMVSSLDDPYTVYLPPTQNDSFKQVMSGQFSGIGAELGMNEKQIVVVAPIDGSPAMKAGIKSGDAIVKVNDENTFGWTLNQAVDKIRGPKGSNVALTIVHKNDSAPKVITITRDTITIKSVTSWTKPLDNIDTIKTTENGKSSGSASLSTLLKGKGDKEVAYIRLSQFGDNTNQEWLAMSNALALQLQRDKNIAGVILDLRNNPGGYVTDAVFIASEFLKVGTPVVVQDYGSGRTETLKVKRNGLMQDTPLVVLINKGSASASEIVAGALRDHKRATLIGEQSFGKGTMQSAEDLGQGAGLHVTIARWLTPEETWVGNGKNGEGLKPDITVELDPKQPAKDTQLEKAIEQLVN